MCGFLSTTIEKAELAAQPQIVEWYTTHTHTHTLHRHMHTYAHIHMHYTTHTHAHTYIHYTHMYTHTHRGRKLFVLVITTKAFNGTFEFHYLCVCRHMGVEARDHSIVISSLLPPCGSGGIRLGC